MLASAARIGLDIESDGMFAYRAQICTVQIAAAGTIAIVDTLATSLEPLAAVLGAGGPVKIVHDVAFDARMLASAGVPLGNVHDTSIAARLLGRTATGLATLARAELGIEIDKTLQHHDWRARPLLPNHLEYLARDVAYLEALAATLWREVGAHEIEAEVLEETRYRLSTAIAAAREPRRTCRRTRTRRGSTGSDRWSAPSSGGSGRCARRRPPRSTSPPRAWWRPTRSSRSRARARARRRRSPRRASCATASSARGPRSSKRSPAGSPTASSPPRSALASNDRGPRASSSHGGERAKGRSRRGAKRRPSVAGSMSKWCYQGTA